MKGFGGSAPDFLFSCRHISAGLTYFWDDIFPGRHITGTTYFRDHMILVDFSAHVFFLFADGFLFSIKELGFWTNSGHWVRVLDVAGSYMYIVF